MILTVCPVSPTCLLGQEQSVCALCLFSNWYEAQLKTNHANNEMQKLVLLAEVAKIRVKNMREKLAMKVAAGAL